MSIFISTSTSTSRENSWLDRKVGIEHQRWFHRLHSLHRLTSAWSESVRSLAVPQAAHSLTRGLSAEVQDNLWMLGSLTDERIEDLLDDTRPEDMLGRLENTVWSVHSWTLRNLFLQSPESEHAALTAVLEQASWKEGRSAATQAVGSLGTPLQDFREIILHLNAHLVSRVTAGPAGNEDFLARRALADEVWLELRGCPHQSPYVDVGTEADRLCLLHAHWMRGFAYVLNPAAGLDHFLVQTAGETPTNRVQRCRQHWHSMI